MENEFERVKRKEKKEISGVKKNKGVTGKRSTRGSDVNCLGGTGGYSIPA